MANVSFIFASSPRRVENTFPNDFAVADLKMHLLKENWPADLVESEKVERLRFFCMGKELEDGLKLGNISRPDNNIGIPIHVHIVKGSSFSMESREDPKWCCSCSIL